MKIVDRDASYYSNEGELIESLAELFNDLEMPPEEFKQKYENYELPSVLLDYHFKDSDDTFAHKLLDICEEIAISDNALYVFHELLRHGLSTEVSGKYGKSLIHVAAELHNMDALRILKNHSAQFDAVVGHASDVEFSAITCAAKSVSGKNCDGIAVREAYDVILFLLENGAKLIQEDLSLLKPYFISEIKQKQLYKLREPTVVAPTIDTEADASLRAEVARLSELVEKQRIKLDTLIAKFAKIGKLEETVEVSRRNNFM